MPLPVSGVLNYDSRAVEEREKDTFEERTKRLYRGGTRAGAGWLARARAERIVKRH